MSDLSAARTSAPSHVDALIVGAGPAGATAAALLARRGWKVLLVERSPWPREKTCGGCLNAAAVEMLRQSGLAEALQPASPIHRFHLTLPRARPLTLDLPPSLAIARYDLDANLVTLAQQAGADFLPETAARLQPAADDSPMRIVTLTSLRQSTEITANVVLAADGIAGSLLNDEPWANWHINHSSHFGISTFLPPASPITLEPATIHMCVGKHGSGYVGLVQLPDGRIHLGAALSPKHSHQANGLAKTITSILQACHHPLTDLPKLQGTPLLTRHRKALGGNRILVLGDAAGYVEPFTGEGISWAIGSALAALTLLPEPPIQWPRELPARWQALHSMQIRRRQRACKLLRHLVRHPRLAAAAITLAHLLPRIPAFAARYISAPIPLQGAAT